MFLDNERNRDSLMRAMEEGKALAVEKGRAVMIGHVWTAELAGVLMEIYPHLIEEGYTLEDLSQIVRGESPDADFRD
ncbi:MAG: hypothetical protein HKM06_05545 [Spirochaetales bacterium]|nr:hypothetical protein [Spirochaetales bacterium]